MVCVIIRTILRELGRAQEKLMPGVSNVIVGELIGSLSRDLVNALGKWESKNILIELYPRITNKDK